jgi:hypothetical protein
MSSKLLHKRSSVSSQVPPASALDLGELALNVYDGKIFTKNTSGDILSFEDSSKTLPTVSSYLSTNNVSISSLTIVDSLSVAGTFGMDTMLIGTGATTVLYTGSDTVGINTEAPNKELTVIGDVSATGTFYGSGSGLTDLTDTAVRSLTADWQTSSTAVQTNSSDWNTAYDYSVEYSSLSSSYLSQSETDSLYVSLTGGTITGSLTISATDNLVLCVASDQKIGINTENPNHELTVIGSVSSTETIYTDGDVEVTDSTKGIILRSPNNSRWRVTVTDSGTLSAVAL